MGPKHEHESYLMLPYPSFAEHSLRLIARNTFRELGAAPPEGHKKRLHVNQPPWNSAHKFLVPLKGIYGLYGDIRVPLQGYRGLVGIMEKKMETHNNGESNGKLKRKMKWKRCVYMIVISSLPMETQMENKTENDMDVGT